MKRSCLLSLLALAALLLSCTQKTDQPAVGPGPDTVTPWLELPAAPGGREVFSHSCTLGGQTVRNYSYCWDASSREALWVAYPLCGAYLGKTSRTEAWGSDPLLPAGSQQNVSGGYREGNNGWYSRGHQIPSADRTANASLNATTFYGTNMTPQDSDFNAGTWAALESKVRSWASGSDTLYVVTGCVLDGSKYYVLDRSGNRVPVPTAYFKAVLRYRRGTTLGRAGYMATAFWYDHASYPKAFTNSQAISVTELERKLGYTLFAALPDKVGASVAEGIKSENPVTVNWWWQ